MTIIEMKIRQLQRQMAAMLSQESYSPREFNKLLEECKRLQELIKPIDQELITQLQNS